jgi:hypothetical protein
LRPEIALLAHLLAGTPLHVGGSLVARPVAGGRAECPGLSAPTLLGLLARPLTLAEMVERLEQGCLALDQVRFRPGQDTIESLSPAQFALVARALGMARGAYRVMVPAERTPGWPPDTVQARRRGTRLRDELVHYGASLGRLLEDPGQPLALAVPAGTAVAMLVRVPDS